MSKRIYTEIMVEGFKDPLVAYTEREGFEDPLVALEKMKVFEVPVFMKVRFKELGGKTIRVQT